jgi:hypothetical protein
MNITKQNLIDILVEELSKIDIDELQATGGARPTYSASESVGQLAVMALQLTLQVLAPDILAGTGAYQGDERITKQLVGKMKGASFVDGKFGPLTRKSLKLAMSTPFSKDVGMRMETDGGSINAMRTGPKPQPKAKAPAAAPAKPKQAPVNKITPVASGAPRDVVRRGPDGEAIINEQKKKIQKIFEIYFKLNEQEEQVTAQDAQELEQSQVGMPNDSTIGGLVADEVNNFLLSLPEDDPRRSRDVGLKMMTAINDKLKASIAAAAEEVSAQISESKKNKA